MSTALPPLTPPGSRLKKSPKFLLNVDQLLASETWALSTGEEFKAAFGLWCQAWKQSPVASLPDDDRILAIYSGAGSRWKKVREVALRGFVKCADGRLYHRTLATEAVAMLAREQAFSDRARSGARSRWFDASSNASSIPNDNASSTPQADEKQSTSSQQAMLKNANMNEKEKIKEKPPSPPSNARDPRLAAIEGGGGWLFFKNISIESEWLAVVADCEPTEITEILRDERCADGRNIHLPSSFETARELRRNRAAIVARESTAAATKAAQQAQEAKIAAAHAERLSLDRSAVEAALAALDDATLAAAPATARDHLQAMRAAWPQTAAIHRLRAAITAWPALSDLLHAKAQP